MTALQDWLSVSPVGAHRIKAVIRAAWRRRITKKSEPVDEPQLMGRGRERC
ncbi:MAG: hypothetical protein K0U78_04065 [Actinomycetia bacterium]|nr:hypothetical protein [Actinomycetes bacterium]